MATLLNDKPPTENHLFDDDKLCDAIKQQGGMHRFFPFKQKKGEKPKRPERKADHLSAYQTSNNSRIPRQNERKWHFTKKFDSGKSKGFSRKTTTKTYL